jgi:hypothetical protein
MKLLLITSLLLSGCYTGEQCRVACGCGAYVAHCGWSVECAPLPAASAAVGEVER